MIEEIDPAEWLGLPTPEEMWRHQAEQCAEELALLQENLAQYRARLAKLIQMFAEADQERMRLRKEFEAQRWTLSRLHVEAAEHDKRRMTLDKSWRVMCIHMGREIYRLGGDADELTRLYLRDYMRIGTFNTEPDISSDGG